MAGPRPLKTKIFILRIIEGQKLIFWVAFDSDSPSRNTSDSGIRDNPAGGTKVGITRCGVVARNVVSENNCNELRYPPMPAPKPSTRDMLVMMSFDQIFPGSDYTTGRVFVLDQSKYRQVLHHHRTVRDLDSYTSRIWFKTNSGEEVSRGRLPFSRVARKTLDSLLTVRGHPDGLKPSFLTNFWPEGSRWGSLVSWSMREGDHLFDHVGLI